MKTIELAVSAQAAIKGLGDRIQSLGLVLGQDAATVIDDDLRAVLKAGSRAKAALDGAIMAYAKFDEKFEVAEAKSPRKILLSKIEASLHDWSGDPDQTAAAISAMIGKKSAGNSAAKPGEKSDGNSRRKSSEKSAQLEGGTNGRNSNESAAPMTTKPIADQPTESASERAASRARNSTVQPAAPAARALLPRRQKLPDPLVSELQRRGASDGPGSPNPVSNERQGTGTDIEEPSSSPRV
jgi:hypothetical protein